MTCVWVGGAITIMSSAVRRVTERLHLGRVPAKGAVYFVTFVTAARRPWLGDAKAADAVLGAVRAWHDEGDGAVLAVTMMPDHVHVLFVLGERLDLGRCVSRWKTVGRQASGYAGEWQRDFWERRVRNEESREDYGLYIFLNPYRARLLTSDEPWQWWWAPEPELFRFTTMLGKQGEPLAEWIDWPDERFAALETGE